MKAALVPMERMGLTPADLAAVPQNRAEMPTFADARAPWLAVCAALTRPPLVRPVPLGWSISH